MAITKSTTLFYKDGSSDKEYGLCIEQVGLDQYVINFNYGRRGSATTTGTKTQVPVGLTQATKIYDKLLAEKVGKGYVARGDGKPFSGVDTAGRQTGLIPMLLNPIAEDELAQYIQDDDWLFQEKLDGKRVMVQIKGGVATASNRKGLSIGIPTELEQELQQLPDCTLDGELVAGTYYIFDLLGREQDLTQKSCENRLGELATLDSGIRDSLDASGPGTYGHLEIVLSYYTTQAKQYLYKRLKGLGEGIVLKRLDSKYIPGRPNSGGSQLKCKFWSSVTCEVSSINDKRSVGLWLDPNDTDIGNVTVPPNHELPKVGDLVEVRYLYAYKGGSLYQPIYLGTRDDVVRDNVRNLKFKQEPEDE